MIALNATFLTIDIETSMDGETRYELCPRSPSL